jgi:hypothetical protein
MQTDKCEECVDEAEDYLCEVCDTITCPSCGDITAIYISKPDGAYCMDCGVKNE